MLLLEFYRISDTKVILTIAYPIKFSDDDTKKKSVLYYSLKSMFVFSKDTICETHNKTKTSQDVAQKKFLSVNT